MLASIKTTLLDLVNALRDCTTNEDELVATVAFLVNSGTVRLGGHLRWGEHRRVCCGLRCASIITPVPSIS